MSEMTNSEIKKDELKPCPFCGGAVELFEVCRPDGIWEIHCFNKDCHAGYGMEDRNEVLKAWNHRTPEPTKAENGGCPVCGTPCDIVGHTTKHYEPKISKEQLLAILPEKSICKHQKDDDECGCWTRNQAIDQMKQRIEELGK